MINIVTMIAHLFKHVLSGKEIQSGWELSSPNQLDTWILFATVLSFAYIN